MSVLFRPSLSLSHTHTYTHADFCCLTSENIHCQWEKWSGTDGIRMIETTHNGSRNFSVFRSLSLDRSPPLSPVPPTLPRSLLPAQLRPSPVCGVQASSVPSRLRRSCQGGSGSPEAPLRHAKSAKRRAAETEEGRRKGSGQGADVSHRHVDMDR